MLSPRSVAVSRIIGHISADTTMKEVSEEAGSSLRFDEAEGEWKGKSFYGWDNQESIVTRGVNLAAGINDPGYS